ncbi:MAG: 7-cyano-7-deazaguanine synthase QueC [Pseudomonadota bacterium]
MSKKAIVLLSGGLDSSTILAMARADGYACYALSFDYGQRHDAELKASAAIAEKMGAADHRVMRIDFAGIGGSALTDTAIAVPQTPVSGIPVTYVPARNTVFLSMALGWAEVAGADAIFIGVNAVDYSGYPDCRPEFIAAYQQLIGVATKAGVEGQQIRLETPLISLSKAEIIQTGLSLGLDYSQTVSCYQADDSGRACGRCDACRLRAEGFAAAGVDDPTRYQTA